MSVFPSAIIAFFATACGVQKDYDGKYRGPLALVADSIFSNRPRMTCRGGRGDECFAEFGESTLYLYASPNDSLTAVAVQKTIPDDSSLTVFHARVKEFESLYGVAFICDRDDIFGENFDRRWQREGYFVVVWAEVPPDGWNQSPVYFLTVGHMPGKLRCEPVPDVPRSL